ncbi:hypothetical protein D9M69_655790 [compost metagenome]
MKIHGMPARSLAACASSVRSGSVLPGMRVGDRFITLSRSPENCTMAMRASSMSRLAK